MSSAGSLRTTKDRVANRSSDATEEKTTAVGITFFSPARNASLASSVGGQIVDFMGGLSNDTPTSLPHLGRWNCTLVINEGSICRII